MKKVFTLIALALMITLNANAQYKKYWDFTNWSAITHANLIAGEDWSDIEKASSTEPTETSKENCFWQVGASNAAGETLSANGQVISELNGLTFINSKERSLAIAVNYPVALNEYHGPSYLWLGSKNINYFIIPHVAPGTTIKMGVESHKTSDPRGVQLFLGHNESGTLLNDPEGNAVPSPTTYEDQTWYVPTDATDTPNSDGTYDVCVRNTNGCHLYYIQVGDADNSSKIAYVYSSAAGDLASDPVYSILNTNENYKITAIDVAGDVSAYTAEALQSYDVTVISSSVPAGNSYANVLKEVIAWSPVLNLNAGLYNTWGYGNATASDFPAVTTSASTNSLFAGLTLQEGETEGTSIIQLANQTPVTGVKLGDYFADDEIFASNADDNTVTAIHAHNIGHNGYLYLPLSAEVAADGLETSTLLSNALTILTGSKAQITNAVAPTYSVEYGNNTADVTLKCILTGSKIYYTTDGSEPTTSSTLYTEPIAINGATQIKAIATAEGYHQSDVADSTIQVYPQAPAPVISVEQSDDKGVITLSSTISDAQIWYNFSGSTETAQSTLYTQPITINDHKTITAFAVSDGYIQSDAATQDIYLPNDKVYIDILSHFDANYNDSKSNGDGLFSWGKSAASATDETQDPIDVKIVDNGDGTTSEVPVYPMREAEIYPAADAEWVVKSNGQSILWQNINPGVNPNDSTSYNPATADDLDTLITKYDVQFYKFVSGEYNGRIESTVKFQGPFNVLTFLGNANSSGNIQRMGVEVSTDGENWTLLGDTIAVSNRQRLYSKYTVSYSGTDEVYVRLSQLSGNSGCQCYDIYILNEGEKSKAEEARLATGVKDINADKGHKIVAVYNINGARLNSTARGINIIKYSDGTVKKVIIK